MADALASGASVRKDVGVQVPPSAPRIVLKSLGFSTFLLSLYIVSKNLLAFSTSPFGGKSAGTVDSPPFRRYSKIIFRQYRIIRQERFASKFCALIRRGFAAILSYCKKSQRNQGEKFPQSAAALIVRCCLNNERSAPCPPALP